MALGRRPSCLSRHIGRSDEPGVARAVRMAVADWIKAQPSRAGCAAWAETAYGANGQLRLHRRVEGSVRRSAHGED